MVIDGGQLDELLEKTSRTFALAIPLLPEELRREVGVGYLLFRIADTLEDAERLGRDERIGALCAWEELVAEPSAARAEAFVARWQGRPPSRNADYNRLVREAPVVLEAYQGLAPVSREAIARHAILSAEGMIHTLRQADERGEFAFETMEQLEKYCYHVAGIVGEMLTELFQARLAPSSARDALGADAAAFGEGLQLVNILKDASSDERDGRRYLPRQATREEVIGRARADMEAATHYVENLTAAGADPGVLAFATLPRTLAEATLDALGSGDATKVDREVVGRLLAEARALAPGQ